MKRSVVALSLLGLALSTPLLAGCSSQSGNSNTDSQVVQPPAASATSAQSQGPVASTGPQPSSTDPAQQTGGNGATTG